MFVLLLSWSESKSKTCAKLSLSACAFSEDFILHVIVHIFEISLWLCNADNILNKIGVKCILRGVNFLIFTPKCKTDWIFGVNLLNIYSTNFVCFKFWSKFYSNFIECEEYICTHLQPRADCESQNSSQNKLSFEWRMLLLLHRTCLLTS